MPNSEHVDKFKLGAEQWNNWRESDPGTAPDLSNATLNKSAVGDAKLNGINLKDVNLTGADLSGVDLSSAQLLNADLTDVTLRDAVLDSADLARAKFCKTDLTKASLKKATLTGAQFCGANLTEAKFTEATLKNTRFRRVTFTSADFSKANLESADFEGERLGGVIFTDAIIRDASMKDADLRTAQGLVLDSTFIRGARFSPNAKDKWSILRRKYTGTYLLFNLLLLVAFIIPYAVRVMMWTGVNRAQTELESAKVKLVAAAETLKKEGHPVATALGEVVGKAGAVTPCLRPQCRELSVWQALLGVDQGISYWLLTTALLLFNVCRAILTRFVGPLRDEEERSGYSPLKKSYRWMIPLHYIVYVLFYVSLVSFLVHGYGWLTAPVFLPAK